MFKSWPHYLDHGHPIMATTKTYVTFEDPISLGDNLGFIKSLHKDLHKAYLECYLR
jgi:hypothetical protein